MALARILRLPVILMLTCIACSLLTGSANSATLTITGTSISTSSTRDGCTITLGYQITSDAATTAYLVATLIGPNSSNDTVKDLLPSGQSVSVTAGTNWYYRNFMVNLPPNASTAGALYDVKYAVNWGTSSAPPVTQYDILTMLSPISVRIPILMYHKIGDALYSQYWITTSMLATHMDALKAYGYTAVTCRDLMDMRAGLKPIPPKPVQITFDGGYENFLADALPTISARGFKMTLFQLVYYMGMDNSWDGDNNPLLYFMSLSELNQAYNTGYVDLQSHSMKHSDLTTCTSSTRTYELVTSRQTLQGYYPGEPIDFFCYPYGSYNLTAEKATRDAGYFGAYAAWGGIETTSSNKWALKRIPIYWDTVTDYDPNNASKFFLNMIGDPMPLPTVVPSFVSYLDPVTNVVIPNNELKWGQTVKVRIIVSNTAAAADAAMTLVLDNDSDQSNGVVYDSHATNPSQDIIMTSWTGGKQIEWLWTVPIDAPTGQYTAQLNVRDTKYVFGYKKANYSAFKVTSDLTTLAGTNGMPDGSYVTLKNAAVTAAFTDCFYIEDDARICGIRVEKAGADVSAGMRVDVAGALGTNASGERCISASIVNPKGSGQIKPLGITVKAVGGGASGYQGGVLADEGAVEKTWAPMSGMNNIGILIRTWGKVKSIDTATRTMVIDDGSESNLDCKWGDNVSVDPNWTYVSLTGISSCEKVGGELHRVLIVTAAGNGEGRILNF